MAGFGLMPAGLGPFGLGTPTTAEAPPTGAAGSRYINPATRDYEQDPATKQLAQMPAVRQQILLAVTTLLASSTTLTKFGTKLPTKMGDTFAAGVNQSVRHACRHITDQQKAARIDRVIVEKGSGGRAQITIVYTDLTTGRGDSLSV